MNKNQNLYFFLFSLSLTVAVSAERHDNCSQRLLVPERYPLEPGTAPPEDIPQELTWAFTRCGTIPVESLLIDDSREGKGKCEGTQDR